MFVSLSPLMTICPIPASAKFLETSLASNLYIEYSDWYGRIVIYVYPVPITLTFDVANKDCVEEPSRIVWREYISLFSNWDISRPSEWLDIEIKNNTRDRIIEFIDPIYKTSSCPFSISVDSLSSFPQLS